MHISHGEQHQIGLEAELAAGDLASSSTDPSCPASSRGARQLRVVTLSSLPERLLVATASHRARTPSSCDDEVRKLFGQFGQGVDFVPFSGGLGRNSNWVTDSGALANRCAHAVRAGVATADHHHMLALGGDDAVRYRVTPHGFVLLRQEFHGEMHAVQFTARNVQVARMLRRRRPAPRHRIHRAVLSSPTRFRRHGPG